MLIPIPENFSFQAAVDWLQEEHPHYQCTLKTRMGVEYLVVRKTAFIGVEATVFDGTLTIEGRSPSVFGAIFLDQSFLGNMLFREERQALALHLAEFVAVCEEQA